MSFNVSQLFLDAFGLKIEGIYSPELSDGKSNMPLLDYSGIKVIDKNEAYHMSDLGTPILFPITLKGGQYNEYNDFGEVVLRSMSDFRLPITAIAEFRRSKIQGKSRAVAGNGTVKETYGFDDWKITIKGFCLNEPSQPQGKVTVLDQEAELLKWENLVDAIEIEGALFEMRNIYNVSINEIPVTPVRGNPNIKPFMISCDSDTPIELILENGF
jgi:hypothetical protein